MTDDLLLTDPTAAAREAADAIARLTGIDQHDVALVMGSGWVPAAELIGETVADLSVEEVPHFAPPAVQGHAGRIRSVKVGDRHALVLLGRTYLHMRQPNDARRFWAGRFEKNGQLIDEQFDLEPTPDGMGILYEADSEVPGREELFISDALIFAADFDEEGDLSEWSP